MYNKCVKSDAAQSPAAFSWQQWRTSFMGIAKSVGRAPYASVIALGKAQRILQGESPCRVRVSHPPVLSLDPTAEPVMVNKDVG
jgi:hypothetical protein